MALFPPIVASSMPAFNVDNSVRIYFTLSDYNARNIEEIARVHVTVRAQSSNKNVLASGEIISKTFQFDQATNRYYIILDNIDINGRFQTDVLYKVQLRFSKSTKETVNPYTDSTDDYSEWSTVCIIKPIVPPTFYLSEFEDGNQQEQGYEIQEDENFFTSNLADFVGIYRPDSSSQTLKYWRLRLLSNNFTQEDILNIDNYTLSDSGIMAVSANNYTLDSTTLTLECSLNYELQQSSSSIQLDTGPNYKVYFEITTKNGYSDGKLYSFTYTPQQVDGLNGTLTVSVNEEEGYIKLDFVGQQSNYLGNLVIRRSDSKGKFSNWKDLKNFEVNGNGSFVYYDFTAESGTFYKYLVQKRDSRGRRGTPVYDQTKDLDVGIFAEWEHPFLLEATGNGNLTGTKQLKLKYDFQISSYKTNISESKTDTLGSQYPYIRRNGNLYYRSFPITGTITEYMDEASLLTDTSEMFDGYYNYYTTFKNSETDEYVNRYDYITERKFREQVEEFLYNAKPKLYKSMQEGNIFIKLMEVSLTPKNELGRLVYSFSGTAYEIDKADIKTFDSYSLINIGEYNPNVYNTDEILGRLSGYSSLEDTEPKPFEGSSNVIGAGSGAAASSQNIQSAIDYNEIKNGQLVGGYSINWLKIEIDEERTPPYRIIKKDGAFVPYNSTISQESDIGEIVDPLYQQEEGFEQEPEIYLGWLFTINGEQIIIAPPNNIYEIKEDSYNVVITQVIPAVNTVMDIDYKVTRKIETDPNADPKKISIKQTNGQLYGTYNNSTNLINNINYKYRHSILEDSERIEKYCNGVQTILVDTDPGVVITLQTDTMKEQGITCDFVVNETGELYFEPGESDKYITSLKFKGKRLYLDELIFDGIKNGINEKGKSLSGHYYFNKLDNQWHCFYINKEYIINTNNIQQAIYNYNTETYFNNQNPTGDYPIAFDIPLSVDAMVFYLAAIRRDIY